MNKRVLDLDRHANVHFIGVVRYPEVRAWVNAFDVALVPHLDTPQTRSMNPLKLFVYCALGVPVVSTRIENIDELREHIAVADDRDAFVRAIETALAAGKAGLHGALREVVERHSWPRRVDVLLQWLDELNAPGRAANA